MADAELTPMQRRLANLAPPWTSETAKAASEKAVKVKKTYTLRGALARRLKARLPDGTRPWDKIMDALVMKCLEGDVRAIDLAILSADGPQATARTVTHGISRDLLIRPDGDLRGVESTPVLPVSAPQSQLGAHVIEPESPQV